MVYYKQFGARNQLLMEDVLFIGEVLFANWGLWRWRFVDQCHLHIGIGFYLFLISYAMFMTNYLLKCQ